MSAFPIPTPAPETWSLDWEAVVAAWPWLRSLAGCPQDPTHHAEGDVWVHTRMVCESLAAMPTWRSLGADDRALVLAAGLFHDVAKPLTTRCEIDGHIRSPGHSRRGEILARELLWKMAVPFAAREQVTALVRYHQFPFYLLEQADARRTAYRVSQAARCDHLALLAEADIRGRICQDAARVLDAIALFAEYCTEERCLAAPRAFASDHSRVLYFQRDGRDPDYEAWDDTRGEVVLMSGLPGVGKDHWIRENLPDHAVVSLDDIREELDAPPTGAQGPVVSRAREMARVHLRQGRSFVWNATNLSRQRRAQCIQLFRDYNARVRIVYLEVPWKTLLEQNGQRERPVPLAAIQHLLGSWEIPDLTEAHRVDRVVLE